MLNIHDHFSWIPVFNASKQKQEHKENYWPIGISIDKMMCVLNKAPQKYPLFPKPIIAEMPLQIPLLDLEKQNLEEK
jgi:chromosome transmission fidelity protein 4